MLSEEKQIKTTIKKLMKKKGLDQKALAQRLHVSLPTVRRVLTKERLTIDRLAAICRILEIGLNELMAIAITHDKQPTFIDQKQEEFFAKNPHYYLYLRYLARGMTPQEVQQEFKLSKDSTRKYVTKLETLGLIKMKDNKAILLIQWPHSFRFPGPMQKLFLQPAGRAMVDHLAEQSVNNQPGWSSEFFYFVNSLRLSPQNYKKCVSEYAELVKKYNHISSVDVETLNWRQLVTAASITGIDRIDFFERIAGPLKNV